MVVADASLHSPAAAASAAAQRCQQSPARKRCEGETPRSPQVSAARDGGVPVQKLQRSREITSRFRTGSASSPSSAQAVSLSSSNCNVAPDVPKRAASTERRRHSTEPKASGNSSKAAAAVAALGSKRNGVFSSLQAESALPLSIVRSKGEACDQSLRPAGNGVRPLVDPMPTKETQRKLLPERKGTPSKRPTVDQAENALPSESFHLKLSSRRWPSARNGQGLAPAMSRSVDVSSGKAAASPNQLAAVLVQDQGGTALKSIHADSVKSRNPRAIHEGTPPSVPSFPKQNLSQNRSNNKEGLTKAKAIAPNHSIMQLQEAMNRADPCSETTQLASLELPPFPVNDPVNLGRLSLGAVRPGANSSPLRAGCVGARGSGQGGIQVAARFLNNASSRNRHGDKEFRPEPGIFSAATAKEKKNHHMFAEYASTSFNSISSSSTLTSPRLSRPPSPLISQPTSGLSKQDKYMRLPSPSRGASSPYRKRLSSLPLPPIFRSSLDLGVDGLKGKKVIVNQQEEAQSLRILQNRLIQWHFVNARAEEAMKVQKAAAEKALVNVWLKTFDLQTSVAMQRIKLQKARQIQKLESLLSAQRIQLEHWEAVQEDHSLALDAVTESLEASTLRIPLTGGTKT
ncbi:hypothetical protein O6H91_15G010000 [Diphasiastrum complanatum]|uniref:Uncharacterized protein n=1 Tax=Diphasiastrum complanatum TaxID=34168 RepID=A0ACC2BFT7_DIPCM|nr:hypothetical protein O6H91_15G010000 [Diphasiastrum complanatum]